MLAMGLSYVAFIMLGYVHSLYVHFLESFYHKWILNFIKTFSFGIYWDDHMVFIIQFVNLVYHTDSFVDTENSLHPWDKSHLIMVYDPLVYCWIRLASILLRIFASVFISDIGL